MKQAVQIKGISEFVVAGVGFYYKWLIILLFRHFTNIGFNISMMLAPCETSLTCKATQMALVNNLQITKLYWIILLLAGC